MRAVIDNDVIYKGACYFLLAPICQAAGGQPNEMGTLSAARFVVESRIRRAPLAGDVNAVLAAFRNFVDQAVALDPTHDEVGLAADLESLAQRLGLPLDAGESQLCSILAIRAIPLMLTGDKRAITALEPMLDHEPRLAPVAGRMKCLEQVVLQIILQAGLEPTRTQICAEAIDQALTYCFSCFQSAAPLQSVLDGLNSYIGDLRNQAPRVLAA